jgi:hypothetical protein
VQREWLEQQRKVQDVAATWPEHIFENFFVLVRGGSSSRSIAAPAITAVDAANFTNVPITAVELCRWVSVSCVACVPLSRVLMQQCVGAAIAVQGLPPDIELTQVAEQLCGKLARSGASAASASAATAAAVDTGCRAALW